MENNREPSERHNLLNKLTRKHVIPVWGGIPERIALGRSPFGDYVGPQGTITLVEYEDNFYGITCDHVLDGIDKELGESAEIWTSVPKDRKLKERLVFRGRSENNNEYWDIAIFEFDLYTIIMSGKEPLPIKEISFNPLIGKDVWLAVGYPGYLMNPMQEQRAHGLLHFYSNIRMHNQAEIVMRNKFANQGEIYEFSGMSGGAIIALDNIGRYQISGIIVAGIDNSERFVLGKKKKREYKLQINGLPISVVVDILTRLRG